jgi:hypothetical protein
VGPRGNASDERRTVELPIVIEWGSLPVRLHRRPKR